MTRVQGMAASLAALLVLVVACGVSDVEASDYDQTCSSDGDCVLVSELRAKGTSCSEGCDEAAINQKEKSKYEADLASARGACTERRSPFCDLTDVAACVRGRCTARPIDAGAD